MSNIEFGSLDSASLMTQAIILANDTSYNISLAQLNYKRVELLLTRVKWTTELAASFLSSPLCSQKTKDLSNRCVRGHIGYSPGRTRRLECSHRPESRTKYFLGRLNYCVAGCLFVGQFCLIKIQEFTYRCGSKKIREIQT